jgi:hypothetical protein
VYESLKKWEVKFLKKGKKESWTTILERNKNRENI